MFLPIYLLRAAWNLPGLTARRGVSIRRREDPETGTEGDEVAGINKNESLETHPKSQIIIFPPLPISF